jgi:hypothetical protein
MLTFDVDFHSDGVLGCILWADETVMGTGMEEVPEPPWGLGQDR